MKKCIKIDIYREKEWKNGNEIRTESNWTQKVIIENDKKDIMYCRNVRHLSVCPLHTRERTVGSSDVLIFVMVMFCWEIGEDNLLYKGLND